MQLIRTQVIAYTHLKLLKLLRISKTETGGLLKLLHLKIGAKVMITTKVDIQDRFKNGQVGEISGFQSLSDRINIIYLKFSDPKIGVPTISGNQYAKENSLVPIGEFQADIPISM